MKAVFSFRRMMQAVRDALFPLECLGCGAAGSYCCGACVAGIRLNDRRLDDPGRDLDAVHAAAAYADPLVRTLLHDLKYLHARAAEAPLEAVVSRWAMNRGGVLPAGAAFVPVPLHDARRRERGFNQAERIARWLAKDLAMDVRGGLLARVRPTERQVDAGERRAENVHGAFRTVPGVPMPARVILVDDVWTTGATMRECAAELKKAGVRRITGFVLAASFRKK